MTHFRRGGSAIRPVCSLVGLAVCWMIVTPDRSTATGQPGQGWSNVGPGEINHPVLVVPSSAVRIPKGWPVAPSGAITCATCHTDAGSGHLRGSSQSLESDYNIGDTRSFCANCHFDSARASVSDHWMGVARAHVTRESDESVGGGSLDAESRQCLACHDGVGARETAYQTSVQGRSSMGSFGERGRNHPVGIAYSMKLGQRGDAPLAPPARLPRTVRLPGGNVSCVSCHNLYSPETKYLSVPIEGSELCFACHDMK